MKIISKFLVCIVILNTVVLNAQTINNQNDTLNIASITTIKNQRTLLHKSIVPLSLIGVGMGKTKFMIKHVNVVVPLTLLTTLS